MDSRQSNSIKVLLLPWLAHGHISPFLELAKALSKRNFYTYVCSTPVNLSSIRGKLSQKHSVSIKLVELHVPALPDLPPQHHTTNGLPPHLMKTLKKAFDMASPSFLNLLKTLKPDLVIYDFLQPWAPAVALSCNIPATLFLTTGAASICCLFDLLNSSSDVIFPFPEIYLGDHEKFKNEFLSDLSRDGAKSDLGRIRECLNQSSNIVLIKTLGEIEGKYMDYLSVTSRKKVVAVGPLVQESNAVTEKKAEVFEWLNKKGRRSTVFVSFGSEYFLSREDMEEIAHGLELSRVNFIWVVRFPVGERIRVEEALPEGFVERVKERGILVEGWAPQARILSHSNIGGFVSHCGWGSVMEGMNAGVPIIGVPMQLDQPYNAKVVEGVGVGVEVKRDESGRVCREEVAKLIREVVTEESGEVVRRKAKEVSKKMREKGEAEMDGVAESLVELCKTND